MFGADGGDGLLQHLHTVDQPGQFLAGDFVGREIARADIGAIEAGKAALGETGIARPHVDELRGDPFGLGAQECQLVGLGAVERQDEQDAMIESFARLVQQECGLPVVSVLHGALGEIEEDAGIRKPMVEMSARFGFSNLRVVCGRV